LLTLALAVAPRARCAPAPGAGGTLRVVMDDDYPPFIFRGHGGELQGILVDQWALWEQKTGHHVQLDAMDWAEAQRRMLAGDYDVIDTMFQTPERQAQYDFGPPYARIDVPIFFSRDLSGISGPKDLEGFIVGAKEGDASVAFLKDRGVTHFQLYRGYQEIAEAARDGRVKVFTVDKPPALYYLIKMGIQDQFRETAPLYSGQFHRAVAKGRPELLAMVQRGFDAITPEEYGAIEKRWYGRPLLTRNELHRTVIFSGTALAILALLLFWIGFLRRVLALRTEELRAISANFTNGMFYQLKVDPAGQRTFTYLSESVASLYGVSVAEAMADASLVYRRIHPSDLSGFQAAEDEAIRTLTPFSCEARVVGPGERERWSSFSSRPRRLANGSLLWDGVEYIITDRVRSEEALRASEAEYRSLVGAVPDLVFTFNQDGDFLTVNTASVELLMVPAEAVVGRNASELLPEPLAEQLKRTIAAVLASGTVQELDYSLAIGGEERFFQGRVAPASAGRVIAVVRDITQAKRLELEQQRLQTHLQQAQKLDSLGRLAGGIAHDMNNVLSAILAIASANLEQQPAGTALHKSFDTITRAAARGGQTVRNLLNFARQSPVQTRDVDLNAVLCDMTQLLERTTLAKVRLDLDLDPGLQPIQGDEGALTNALMNLAVNAVDAMNGEGTLSLQTRNLEPGRVEVTVGDTGSGMAPEVLQKALDPFFTTKETGKGTGLGLSIAYGTIKAHRGTMDIRSEPGRGTKVVLRFPIRVLAPAAAANAAPPAGIRESAGLQVLLVDDDELVNDSLQGLLAALGHQAEPAASGEEALAKVERGYRPELVLLDVNMPGLGAQGALPRLRQLLPEVPIVLVTGKADQAVLDLARSQSNLSLLPKPFNLEDLRQHLGTLGSA
jgi:PAS domain S-box-containing protein